MAPAVFLALCVGCGGASDDPTVSVGAEPDAGDMEMEVLNPGCDMIELDGDVVVERERDFTATYRVGEPYTKTVLLFGGNSVTEPNVLSNAYVLGLDKVDALEIAEEYPDFYLCSSPGGIAAANLIRPYDLVPASCEIYQQLVVALRQFNTNRESGGDRTSLRFDGAPLELESVIDDASGIDVTDQVHDQVFHLITSVEQLTGESVLSFGTSN
jgi:hypothetical protein